MPHTEYSRRQPEDPTVQLSAGHLFGTWVWPLPQFDGPSARDDLTAFVAFLAERSLDRRASSMLRALQAGACAFPGLYRRYFDVELVREVLVAPVLARMSSGSPEGPGPEKTSRQLVDLIYDGIRPAP
jgi:hypothetical protein